MDPVLESFLKAIKPCRPKLKSITLFGSRARGDDRPDSDYDLLLVTTKRDQDLNDRLYDGVMDVLLSTGRLVSLKLFTESDYQRLSSIPTPFMSRVMKEGIKIG